MNVESHSNEVSVDTAMHSSSHITRSPEYIRKPLSVSRSLSQALTFGPRIIDDYYNIENSLPQTTLPCENYSSEQHVNLF